MVDEWRQVRLGEVVNLKRGYDLPKRMRHDGPFPVVSSSGLTGTHNESKVQPPGVVTGRYGTLGQVYYIETPMWPLNTTLYVEDFRGNIPRFVAYLLESLKLDQLVSSAAVPGINRNHLHPLLVRIPEISIQSRIASVLGALDSLIDNSRHRIEILEEMARLLYQEWFVHFRYPGHEDVDLVESEMGSIPKGWTISCLADEAELRRKNIKPYEYEEEEFDHYSIPAFDANRRPSIDVGSDIRSGKYVLTGKSILVSKLNPRIPRTWRADPAMGHRRAVASTEFLVLTEPTRWPLAFIYGLVSSTEFMNALAATAGGTSTSHQRVKPADVMATAVLGPPVKLVEMYTEAVEPMLSLADILLRQVEVLREARDLLLPRLVSGELDISDLDLELEAVGV